MIPEALKMLILGGRKKSEIFPSYPHLFSSALIVPLLLTLCFPTDSSCSPAQTKCKPSPEWPCQGPCSEDAACQEKTKTNCRYEVRCEIQVKILLNYKYPEFWGRKGLTERAGTLTVTEDSTSTHGHKHTDPKNEMDRGAWEESTQHKVQALHKCSLRRKIQSSYSHFSFWAALNI